MYLNARANWYLNFGCQAYIGCYIESLSLSFILTTIFLSPSPFPSLPSSLSLSAHSHSLILSVHLTLMCSLHSYCAFSHFFARFSFLLLTFSPFLLQCHTIHRLTNCSIFLLLTHSFSFSFSHSWMIICSYQWMHTILFLILVILHLT